MSVSVFIFAITKDLQPEPLSTETTDFGCTVKSKKHLAICKFRSWHVTKAQVTPEW